MKLLANEFDITGRRNSDYTMGKYAMFLIKLDKQTNGTIVSNSNHKRNAGTLRGGMKISQKKMLEQKFSKDTV